MKVYHGSYTEIDVIDLSKCERNKDFGRGFYVTKFRKQAEEWAVKIGHKYNAQGIVTEFQFFESAFFSWEYRVLRFNEYSEEWLNFVVMNRNPNHYEQMHEYDIVEGPVADDKIQYRIERYLKGQISKEKFLSELIHRNLTHQICFCTERALMMLEHVTDDSIFEIEDIGEAIIDFLIGNKDMNEMEASDLFYTSATFAQLSDKCTGLYLKSWTEILEMLITETSNK